MSNYHNSAEFRKLAENIRHAIMGYGSDDQDFTEKQRQQVNNLVRLERKFKKVLQNDCRGEFIYKKFIDFIWHSGKDNKRNTLSARPYFRERQSSFSKGISPAIRKKQFKKLYKFNINYTFIEFVLSAYPWRPGSKVVKAAKEVYLARQEIITLNMPLAISRARIFKQKTPESHLTYMDLVQISFEGLINAVDKFVLPYTPVFRSVIIGRIVGDLIENYSDTMLHFYPSDKRKIYRANKAQRTKTDAVNYERLAYEVNSGTKLENPTNASEIQHLTTASSHLSLDLPVNEDSGYSESDHSTLATSYPADDSIRPDTTVEQNELYTRLYQAVGGLDLIEQKLIKMLGIDNIMEA